MYKIKKLLPGKLQGEILCLLPASGMLFEAYGFINLFFMEIPWLKISNSLLTQAY